MHTAPTGQAKYGIGQKRLAGIRSALASRLGRAAGAHASSTQISLPEVSEILNERGPLLGRRIIAGRDEQCLKYWHL